VLHREKLSWKTFALVVFVGAFVVIYVLMTSHLTVCVHRLVATELRLIRH